MGETGHAGIGPDPERAQIVPRQRVDVVAGRAGGQVKVAPGDPIMRRETTCRAEPDLAGAIECQGTHEVRAKHTVGRDERPPFGPIEPAGAAPFGAEPHVAAAIGQRRGDNVVGQAIGGCEAGPDAAREPAHEIGRAHV